MCGIAGIVGPAADDADVGRALAMMHHRGPDHARIITEPGLALGYCRLAIRSIGPHAAGGEQPFSEAPADVPDVRVRDARIHAPAAHDLRARVVCFASGEVYNSVELRRASPVAVEPGAGDIGGLLAAYLARGVNGLDTVRGEFACAIYDRRTRTVVLARDHAGTRPLFYKVQRGSLYYASEISALVALGVNLRPDLSTVGAYLRYNYPLAPATWYEGIRSVPAGCALQWRAAAATIITFADPSDLAVRAARGPHNYADEALLELVRDAVAVRTEADVRLGFHLSGGVDSSLLIQLGAAEAAPAYTVTYDAAATGEGSGFTPHSTIAVKTPGRLDDDAAWASRVSADLGLTHHLLRVTAARALERVPEAIGVLNGPLMSPGALTPLIVAEAAKSDGVTVLLEGQGADEVFLGYCRFRQRWYDRAATAEQIAANLHLSDIARAAPSFLASARDGDASYRLAAAVDGVNPLVGFQVAYQRFFLQELLRIEDHVHFHSGVENRPPYLDRAVRAFGFAATANDPAGALDKQALRRVLSLSGSVAAGRTGKQQMTMAPAAVVAWARHILANRRAQHTLVSFDVPWALHVADRDHHTTSEWRMLWAMANLFLWCNRLGFEL